MINILLKTIITRLLSDFWFFLKDGATKSSHLETMVAGVFIFTFRTIESPITRALSSGFSVGASLSGENMFDVLIETEKRCFFPATRPLHSHPIALLHGL